MLAQILGAIVYTNLVEYLLHRWYLHGVPTPSHVQHHREPDAPTVLVKLDVWALFALHAGVLIALHWYTALSTIAIYLVLLELLHRWQHAVNWGWHMLHHQRPLRRFNVFLPIWDFLLGTL